MTEVPSGVARIKVSSSIQSDPSKADRSGSQVNEMVDVTSRR